jgi:hypothetical protein
MAARTDRGSIMLTVTTNVGHGTGLNLREENPHTKGIPTSSARPTIRN